MARSAAVPTPSPVPLSGGRWNYRWPRGSSRVVSVVVGIMLLAPVGVGPLATHLPAAANGPSVVNVSTSTPYKSPVDITIEDLPAGTYDVFYWNFLGDPTAPTAPALFDPFSLPFAYWGEVLFTGEVHDGGDLELTVADWFSIGDERNLLPGVIVVLLTGFDPDLLAAGDFSAVVAASAQMFPGAVGNGAPVYTIAGPGFVDGAFVAGEEIEVTATGFPEGTDEFAAFAWIPTVPSTGDVSLDFWRDFLNGCIDLNSDFNCPVDPEPAFDTFGQGNPGQSAPGSLEGVVARGIAPSADMSVWVYHFGLIVDTSLDGNERSFFGYDTFLLADFVATLGGDAVESPASSAALTPSVSCVPLTPTVGGTVTCTVTGGDAGIDILWRAAYNPVIAEAGVTLDASGSGEFSFTVPAAALGEELTVELVDWTAPMSIGVAGGPVPASVPAGEGPVPSGAVVLALLAAASGAVLVGRRLVTAG